MSRNRRARLGMLAAWQPNWSTCAAVYLANAAPRSPSAAEPADDKERRPIRSRQASRLRAYQPAIG
jgi:hypothetical protein